MLNMIDSTSYRLTVSKLIIATAANEKKASLLKIMCIGVDNDSPQAILQT
jgi:hypothetical protein